MRGNFTELPAPVCDHDPAFAQRVEDLPSEVFPTELVVEALMPNIASAYIFLSSGFSFSRAFSIRLIHLPIFPAPTVMGGD